MSHGEKAEQVGLSRATLDLSINSWKHFRSNKMLGLNKRYVQTKLSPEYFCFQKNVGLKILWVHKHFEPEQIFESKEMFGPTNY